MATENIKPTSCRGLNKSSLAGAADLRVGRVDATAHNGIARTFGADKYPWIMLFEETGVMYDFHGGRSIPRLIAFGRGAPEPADGSAKTTATMSDVPPSDVVPEEERFEYLDLLPGAGVGKS